VFEFAAIQMFVRDCIYGVALFIRSDPPQKPLLYQTRYSGGNFVDSRVLFPFHFVALS